MLYCSVESDSDEEQLEVGPSEEDAVEKSLTPGNEALNIVGTGVQDTQLEQDDVVQPPEEGFDACDEVPEKLVQYLER